MDSPDSGRTDERRPAGATSPGDTPGPEPAKREKVLPPKAKAKQRIAPGGQAADAAGARYTSPAAAQRPAPSPPWVPVLMFGLWGLGLVVIALNYMDVLPGATDGGNGWYLIAGLVAILGGIVAATKYH